MPARIAAWRDAVVREFGSPALLAATLALGAAAGAFLYSQGLQPCDDAYITFRHARNLARDLRPAWNLEGPAVLGSTSPAWVFLLGGLGRLTGTDRVDELALGVNAVCLVLATVLAYLVARDLTGRTVPSLLAAALVGFNSITVFILSLGFEQGLFLVVLFGGLYLVRKGRDVAAVLLASLAPLVRPEGLLLTPLVWGVILFRRRFRARLLVAYALVPLAWLAFARAYYGSPVPQSIRARSATPSVFKPYAGGQVDLGRQLVQIVPATARLVSREARAYLFGGYERLKDRPSGRMAPAWLTLLGLPLLVATLVRRRDDRLAYLLYAPLFLVLFAWIGRLEAWYLPSFVAFASLTLFYACVVSFDRAWELLERRGRRVPPAVRALAWVAAAVLLATASNYARNPGLDYKGPVYARDPRGPMFERSERERFNGYRRVAGILNRRGGARASVLTSEVGVFGFFYRGPVIDTVGLCSPEALAFYPPPAEDIWDEAGRYLTDSNNITPTAMVLVLRPEYVVNSLAYIKNLVRPGSPFLAEYVPVGTFGTAWGEPLLIYRRASSAAAE